jgi:arginyl-tRNA synthetase
MDIFKTFAGHVDEVLAELAEEGAIPAGLDSANVAVEPPRDAAHGDLATNAALVLAKQARLRPRDLAQAIADRLSHVAGVAAAEVAGPGFINLRLDAQLWTRLLGDVLEAGADYGRSDVGGGRKVNVEFVSANPTGPMHVGHSRGAVFGDALAALLEFTGHEVTREYYVNDAGAQVEALARSTWLRYREALGEAIGAIPSGLYPGEYLRPVGERLAKRDGARWREAGEAEWLPAFRKVAVDAMMAQIEDDLEALGVHMDRFAFESALVEAGRVDQALEILKARGLIYTGVLEPPKGRPPEDWEPRQQTLFRATEFGDDTDRPLKKSDGSWTYFASDIAYHLDKFERGFADMIDVWGADHAGYVKRMQAAVNAITEGRAALDVKICQLVNLLDAGQPVKMSKRAGTFVTLREVVEAVGKDVVRFIMLTRRNDAPLDFDFAKVTEKSRDNPVFYVQYAHARIRSVERKVAGDSVFDRSASEDERARLAHPDELALIKMLAGWPRAVEGAALAHEPHRLAFFLYDVASAFHALWNKGNEDASLRFLVEDDAGLARARLALIRGVKQVIAAGLGVIGVTPVEEMR